MPRIVSEKHSPNKQTSAFSDLAEVIVICSKHHQKSLMTTDVSAPMGPLLPLQSQCSDCFTFRITQVSSSVTILGKNASRCCFPLFKTSLESMPLAHNGLGYTSPGVLTVQNRFHFQFLGRTCVSWTKMSKMLLFLHYQSSSIRAQTGVTSH